jgi:rhodanese-related sulfurtransferase
MRKNIITTIGLTLIVIGSQLGAEDIKITEKLSSITAKDKGNEVVIKRIQNPNTKLNSAFLNTKKECPPYCIQPMNIGDVKTLGELEVLEFIKEMKDSNNLLLIDARTREWYKKGTIPSAINLPFTMLKKDGKYIDKILTLLGGKKVNGKWNFDDAQTLLIFSNGAWDEQATNAIKSLLDMGYPADKLRYYRGGVQMWNLVGLTVKK